MILSTIHFWLSILNTEHERRFERKLLSNVSRNPRNALWVIAKRKETSKMADLCSVYGLFECVFHRDFHILAFVL